MARSLGKTPTMSGAPAVSKDSRSSGCPAQLAPGRGHEGVEGEHSVSALKSMALTLACRTSSTLTA